MSAVLFTSGCALMSSGGSTASNSTSNTAAPASITITPANPVAAAGAKLQFTALVSNTSNTAVSWSTNGGVITSNGLFTVPNAKSGTVYKISATSNSGSSAQSTTSVSVAASSNGNSGGNSGSKSDPPAGADNRYCNVGDVPNFGAPDGPAAVPTACYQTAMSSTPSLGTVTKVAASANIQTAVDNANCGDILVLQAGQSYSGFSLPAKGCDSGHYITIESSAVGTGLPPEGTRATPCNAGVASLPGRPALNCVSTTNVMAQVAGVAKQTNIISNSSGANYYRFIGLEIADTEANGAMGGFYDLVNLTSADHIIFDRCWIHGSPTGEDVKGVSFSSSTYIAVIDSYISDIHSKLSGYGADSSAIGSVTGTGPVKIVDDFLEASGVTVFWGGGASTANISDVEMRRNHVFKPFTWWTLSSTYFGTAFEVKNLFENKSGVRELVEGNIFEDNWAQAQKGTAILFSPKNQWGECAICAVHDVIFRYNIVRHSVNAIGLAVVYATTCPGESGDGTGKCLYASGPLFNLSIHDNLLDDINQPTYFPGDCCSDGYLFALNANETTNWPQSILIAHNTGFPVGSGTYNVTIQGSPEVFANFTFQNNLMTTGTYSFHQVLPGNGLPGCGVKESGTLGALNGCMGNTWTMDGNVLANTSASTKFPADPLPPANYEASSVDSVGFTDYNNGNGGNYVLLPSSPYKNAGTDGKDPGADFSTLSSETAGII